MSSDILDVWDGAGYPEKIFRVRWATTCNIIRSGWLPNNYPSFKELKGALSGKKIKIELEHVKTAERFQTNEIPVEEIKQVKFLRLISDGHSDTVAIGLDDGINTFWVFQNGKVQQERNK